MLCAKGKQIIRRKNKKGNDFITFLGYGFNYFKINGVFPFSLDIFANF